MTETTRPRRSPRIVLPFPQHSRAPETRQPGGVSLLTLGLSNSPDIITHCAYHLRPSFKLCCCQGPTKQLQEEAGQKPLLPPSVGICTKLHVCPQPLSAALLLYLPWQESCNLEEPSCLPHISAGSQRWGGVCRGKHSEANAQNPRQSPHPAWHNSLSYSTGRVGGKWMG